MQVPYADQVLDDDPDMVNRRDSVMIRLLLACRQSLTERGMVGMFVDGMKSDETVLSSLGKEQHLRWESHDG